MAPTEYRLTVTLCSDTAFSRGDGVPGLVDSEVEHDPATGLPFIPGRTLKGLLVEECANTLFALESAGHLSSTVLAAAAWLFGSPGSKAQSMSGMTVSDALLPDDLRRAVAFAVAGPHPTLSATEVLESLTAIRRQSAVGEATGAPAHGALRSLRVVLRDTTFTSTLHWDDQPPDVPAAEALLAVCALSVRRGGTGRTRGRGRLRLRLRDADDTKDLSAVGLLHFSVLAGGKS